MVCVLISVDDDDGLTFSLQCGRGGVSRSFPSDSLYVIVSRKYFEQTVPQPTRNGEDHEG